MFSLLLLWKKLNNKIIGFHEILNILPEITYIAIKLKKNQRTLEIPKWGFLSTTRTKYYAEKQQPLMADLKGAA